MSGHRDKSAPVWREPIRGNRHVRMLHKLVRELREEDSHGNRELFLDDVVIAHLLAFFNSTLRSLRIIEDFSQTVQAQRFLSIRKLCRSTLSDYHRVADPTLLSPIIERLRALAVARDARCLPGDLPQVFDSVLAVDGSFFNIAADIAWALNRSAPGGRPRGKVRLDLQVNVATWLPEVIDVSGRGTSEAQFAAQAIRPGAIHLYDRGIFSFELLTAQQAAGAYFVHRLRVPGTRSPKFNPTTTRELTANDREAQVLSDREGLMAGSTHCPPPSIRLREVVIHAPDEPGGTLRLLTNLFDVEACVIGQLYRYRWQVELFFRWLKVYANFAHLISHSRPGVLLSFYVAVIGVMLIYLQTEVKPSKYAFSLLGLVAQGGATLEEIAPILKERERQIALERARLAKRKKETS